MLRLMIRIGRRAVARYQWEKEYNRLRANTKGKPIFEEDGVTPQKDHAAVYAHLGIDLRWYPPPFDNSPART